MTEQEKRRRRREMERRMRTRTEMRKKTGKKRGLAAFRIYVTAILTGGCLLISAFHSDTSEMVCSKVKQVIGEQISMAEVMGLKDRVQAYFAEKDIVFPVFDEMQEETKVYHPDIEDSP